MTPHQVLEERARRHNLRKVDEARWMDGATPIIWSDGDLGVRWNPPGAPAWHAPIYPTAEAALTAALHYLDCVHPERAWRPSPGAQLAEVVKWVRLARQSIPVASGTTLYLERVLRLLESLALPPKRDEGQVLQVALEYLLHRGGLPESARAALVLGLRECPELVEEARLLGPWIPHGSIKDDPEPWAFYRFPAFGLEKVLEVRSEFPISNPGEEWVVVIDDERLPGSYETPEEAREAADKAAKDRGWWPMAGIQEPFGGEEEPEEPLERNQFPEDDEEEPDEGWAP